MVTDTPPGSPLVTVTLQSSQGCGYSSHCRVGLSFRTLSLGSSLLCTLVALDQFPQQNSLRDCRESALLREGSADPGSAQKPQKLTMLPRTTQPDLERRVSLVAQEGPGPRFARWEEENTQSSGEA